MDETITQRLTIYLERNLRVPVEDGRGLIKHLDDLAVGRHVAFDSSDGVQSPQIVT